MKKYVEITTVIGCKMACVYCPQQPLVKAYRGERVMSLDTFKRCVDRMPGDVDIHFSGFAEAWLNPCATEMLIYAHKRGHRVQVFTTLAGMTLEHLERMQDVPVLSVGVHFPDMHGWMKLEPDDEYIRVADKLNRRDTIFSKYAKFMSYGRVHPALKHIRSIRYPYARMISRGGNVELVQFDRPKVERIKGPIKCSRRKIGAQPVLIPSGELALCCCDYSLAHILGNLLEVKRYDDIWKGKPYRDFLELVRQEDSDLLCRTCEWARSA